MFRVFVVLSWIVVSCGCIDTDNLINELLEDHYVSPAGQKKIDAFAKELQVALENEDWDAVSALYWSGAKMTPEQAEKEYAPLKSKSGSISYCYLDFFEYDASNLFGYIDEEKFRAIGAPAKIWRGDVEVFYGSTDAKQGMDLALYMGEVNGKFVILALIKSEAFDDR